MMNDSSQSIPRPGNPYRVYVVLLLLLTAGGVIAIATSGMGSLAKPRIGLFVAGIMVLTLVFICGIGVLYGWRGFEKRFGPGGLLGYWEIPKKEWVEHLEREKKRLLNTALVVGIGLPVLLFIVLLVLADSDGEMNEVMPVACAISGFMVVVILTLLAMQWFALKGNLGRVWLSERGLMMNRTVFFIDGYGMNTLSREVLEEEGKHVLSIRYQVQSKYGVIDKELLVPVPEEQLELVLGTVERWNS